ncbi:MAG: DinB family protein [Candidatus Thorarchaeota archaeon]|nr:DinB family protein [Candidatus Thorarchaeota archaeon]
MSFVKSIINYTMWANDTIWRITEKLTDEEFSRDFDKAGGSIRLRYIHLAEDTWEWYHDWHCEEPEEPDFSEMTRGELYKFTMDYIMKWRSLIDELTVNSFKDERNGKVVIVTLDEMIFHLANHHTYHRGQIVMGLRLLGKNVEMTDYVPYRFKTA